MADSEKDAIAELMAMTDAELDMVPYDIVKWICSGKKCTRHTKVRDYGLAPVYFHAKMEVNNENTLLHGEKIPKMRWHDTSYGFFMCAKHCKMWKRLVPKYGEIAVNEKIFNPEKTRIEPLKPK